MGQESNLHSAKRAVYSRLVSPVTRPMLRVIRGNRTHHLRDHNPVCCRCTMNTTASRWGPLYPQPESNRRPPASEAGALSTELQGWENTLRRLDSNQHYAGNNRASCRWMTPDQWRRWDSNPRSSAYETDGDGRAPPLRFA